MASLGKSACHTLLHVDEVIALNDGRAHRDPYLNHEIEESFRTVSNSSCLRLPLECMQGAPLQRSQGENGIL